MEKIYSMIDVLVKVTKQKQVGLTVFLYGLTFLLSILFIIPMLVPIILRAFTDPKEAVERFILLIRPIGVCFAGIFIAPFAMVPVAVAYMSCVNDTLIFMGTELYLDDNTVYTEEAARSMLLN